MYCLLLISPDKSKYVVRFRFASLLKTDTKNRRLEQFMTLLHDCVQELIEIRHLSTIHQK